MNMKILFIGMGSIGQRHLQNIQFLYGEKVKCFAVRSTLHNNYIKDGVATPVENLANHYQINVFNNLDEALVNHTYDAVFITNPSSLHAEAILKCLDYQINIFVEKPLCINLEETKAIKDKLACTDSILYVGYQTHFDPIFQKVNDLIVSDELGGVVSARFEWCTFLPDHHKYEDYRMGYAARSDLGGGALLGLSHEIDIVLNFFGMPKTIKAVESSNRRLDINADDTVMALCKYSKDDKRIFSLSIVLSYSQVIETREFKIQCENGFIDCDWVNGKVNIVNRELSSTEVFESNMSRNEVFIAQTKGFVDAVYCKDTSITNIDNSLNVLKFIEDIKKGML